MSLSTIRTSLQALVAGVNGIAGTAPVHDYWRHVTDAAKLQEVLVGANQDRPHYWIVTLADGNPLSIVRRMGCDDGVYRWDVHGYYALNDEAASEKTWLDIVERVMDVLRVDRTLGGTVREVEGEWPAWIENDQRMLVSTLFHHVRIKVSYKQQLA